MKILIIPFALLLFCHCLYSQTDSNNINTPAEFQNLQLINSTDSTIFILKQEYVLWDTIQNKTYPKPGKTYFGKAYYAAILVDSLLWTDSKLFTPELGDTSFLFYKERYGFKPQLTHLLYRTLHSSVYDTLRYSLFHVDEKIDSVLNKHAILLIQPEGFKTNALQIEYNTSDTSGLALILFAENKIEHNDTAEIQMQVYQAFPDFDNNARLTIQPEMRHIIGGFYLTVFQDETGVQLSASGYIRRFMGWYVKPFPDITNISD
jgi:hypothetical protein